jgi:beta-galactosidase
MVLRDINHPSVIIWSNGNEIKERADSSGLAIAKMLKDKIKEMDSTRPVTQAICSFWDNPGLTWDDTAPAFAQMDVHGYNYQWKQYEPDHEKYPERIMIGTESIAQDAFKNWALVEKHPYVIGDFVWTGMDYFGESGIGSTKLDNEIISFLPPWPWYNGYCGDISVLGYKKPQMYFRDVVWRNSELEMLVHSPIPKGRKEIVSFWGWPDEQKSWNWEGSEGQPIQVSVYTRCDLVQLELNGEVVAKREVTERDSLIARFNIQYEPGELVAIGFKEGKEAVRQSIKTTGEPAQLKVEKDQVKDGENDLAYFNIEVLDGSGNLVPNAEIPVDFEIQGKGKLQAVGNGNPTDMKSFQQPHVKTFRGKCQVIIRLDKEGGEVSVSAKSEGLKAGSAIIQSLKGQDL